MYVVVSESVILTIRNPLRYGDWIYSVSSKRKIAILSVTGIFE